MTCISVVEEIQPKANMFITWSDVCCSNMIHAQVTRYLGASRALGIPSCSDAQRFHSHCKLGLFGQDFVSCLSRHGRDRSLLSRS